MPRIVIRPLAVRELDAQADYIARSSPAAARRLHRAAEKAFLKLAQHPAIGAAWESQNPALSNIRFWPIRGFPNHLIFYRPLSDGIEVIRVLHAAQNLTRILERG